MEKWELTPDIRYASVLPEAFKLSSLSTVGFFAAYFVALTLMLYIRFRGGSICQMSKKEQGKFGWVMVFVEFIDALPEAAMIAQISVEGVSSSSLMVALFIMNFANGFSTTFDIMATVKSRIVYATMFVVLHFSIGVLTYAIAVNVYQQFGFHYRHGERDNFDILFLYVGTCFGSLFVVCNLVFHHWSDHKMAIEESEESEESLLVNSTPVPKYQSNSNQYSPDICCSERKTFIWKIVQTFIILIMLYIWTVGWTLVIATVFLFFQSPENSQILVRVGVFLEGVGGGAFLSTIACSILVKINECFENLEDSYPKQKKFYFRVMTSSARTFFFIAGLIVANFVDITTSSY